MDDSTNNWPLPYTAVRDWVGDYELEKARPYSDGAALLGVRRDGSRLFASVQGRRVMPYSVVVELSEGEVRQARCGCPVGTGRCKHVAAVLVAYAEDPQRFADVTGRVDELSTKTHGELLELVVHLLRVVPALTAQLAVPLPGYGHASAETFRHLTDDVIRAVRMSDEWVEEELVQGLSGLLGLMHRYEAVGDEASADAVAVGITSAVHAGGLDVERFAECVAEPRIVSRLRVPPKPEAPF